MLPKEKSKPKNELYEYNWMIYGQPKVGKTTFVSKFDDPLFICTEDRHKHLDIFKIPEKGCINNWVDILLALKEIDESIEKKTFKWKTIVIDTIDNAYKFCSEYVLKKNGLSHESDMEYGKGYALVKAEFFRVMSKLCSLGVAVVFISHAEERAVKDRVIEITRTGPSLPSSGKKVLLPLVDIIGFIGFDKKEPTKRMLYLQGDESLEAGCATSKNMPPIIELDFNKISETFKK